MGSPLGPNISPISPRYWPARPPSCSDPPLVSRRIFQGIEQIGNFFPQSNEFLILCRQILVSPTQFYVADRVRHTQLPENLLKISE
jgi:hypothetical protein